MNSKHQGHHNVHHDNGSLQPHDGATVYAVSDDTAVHLRDGHDGIRGVDVDQGEGNGDLHLASAELEHGSGELDPKEIGNAETHEGNGGAPDSGVGFVGDNVAADGAGRLADDDASDDTHRDNRSDADLSDQGTDAVPASDSAMGDIAQTVSGVGDPSGDGAAVPSAAALEERLVVSPAESWLRNLPKHASDQAAYTQAAVASLLGRVNALERVLSDTCRTVTEIVSNVNGIVGFINGMSQNKELLLAMMQNATMLYNELERTVLQEAYGVKHEFSIEESDEHSLRLTILDADGKTSPKVEIRNEDGVWVEDKRAEVEVLTANYLMLEDAVKAGYGVDSVVYVKTVVGAESKEA